VAEAAKVIENTQRDINIALMNELRIIFDKMGISTRDVLDAARTKWNFLPFEPGLVGGHCISVDPYYLAYKAEELDYHPQVIMAGRRINDEMGRYFARELVMKMIHTGTNIRGARVLVLGFTFKENCPDIRNTRVIDLVRGLQEFGVVVDVHDPVAYADEMEHEYGLRPVAKPRQGEYDAVLLAVKHRALIEQGRDALAAYAKLGFLFDIKQVWQ
jgi:UDP-N-acetyl-D-galactosamine dehydrogenase